MAISLSDIRRSTLGPPRMVLYGVPGIGKTTLAAQAPSAIFIPVEDGLGKLDVQHFPQPKTYKDLLECIDALASETHEFSTVVLDSLDAIEPLLWAHVCDTVPNERGSRVGNIHGYGYQKGLDHARTEWLRLLGKIEALRERGMATVAVAHSTIAKIDPPDTDPYDRYQIRLEKKSEAVVFDWADAALFLNYEVATVTSEGRRDDRKRGVGTGKRIIYTTQRPAWNAKNRYQLPDRIELDDPAKAWAVIESCIQPAATQAASAS